MTANPTPNPTSEAPAKIIPGWRRWLLTLLSVLLLLTFLGLTLVYLFAYDLARLFIESPRGEEVASTSVGPAVKVDGEFAPLHLEGWTIVTDSFTSTGWPGEAIGGLNMYGVRAEFDPAAVWRGVYHIKGIQVERGQFTLLTPDNALKRPPKKKKPKPWYAHFLPSVFECGPIITPDATVDFEFEKQKAHILHAHLQADLIGRDFRYTATSGTLAFPYLPQLHINHLVIMVTRPMITIEDAQLSGLDPADPARLTIHGNLGQHADKTVNAIIKITQMPIEQVLPPELAATVHGRATGFLTWKRDKEGKDIYSDGEVDVSGATIDDLSVFKQLSILHGNPDLLNFTFDKLNVKFHMKNGHFAADLVAVSNGKFSLAGTIDYDTGTKQAGIQAKLADLPLQTWLPTDFKPRTAGVATASFHWQGKLDTIKDSSGALSLNLDGAYIGDPVFLRRLLAKKKLRAPEELLFKTAEFDITYQDQTFQLTRAQLDLPGVVTASATGTLAPPDSTIDATMVWSGLRLDNWLPPRLADEISGDINGDAKFHLRQWKLKDGAYGGDVQMVNGFLRYTSVQSTLARFVGDKRLLQIPLTRASFSFTWNAGALTVTNIDLRGSDDIGVEGNLATTRSGKLSGQLWVGTRPAYLASLKGLGNGVFYRNAEGLRWARVNVSGTVKEPKQDLSEQLVSQLHQHPTAIFGLSGKLVSWYAGNLFGAEKEWKRPNAPEVSARASK